MQNTSALYKTLWENPNHYIESRVIINNVEYTGTEIMSLKSHIAAFGEYGNLTIGKAPSRSLSGKVIYKGAELPDMAAVVPQMRVCVENLKSEWLPKGFFFIDRKETDFWDNYLTFTAYDVLMQSERTYTSALEYPALDVDVLREISANMATAVDARTWEIMTEGWTIPTVEGMTMREVLGQIAGLYMGCFVTNELGELRLLSLTDTPSRRIVANENGYGILVGGVAIGV